MPSILIVDDEANIRASLKGALGREGYQVDEAASVAAARPMLREAYDFVLLDVWYPNESGLDLLAEIHTGAPETTVVMMSGHATIETAVQATRLGAFDFLEKPIALERLLVLLRNARASQALEAENRRLREAWSVPLVGDSAAIRALLDQIARAGPSAARVLIHGEHGTGKELVARALHASSLGLEVTDLFPPRESQGGPLPRRRLLSAGQALDLLHDEAQLIALCGSNIAHGVELTEADQERCLAAAGRIAYLRDEVTA